MDVGPGFGAFPSAFWNKTLTAPINCAFSSVAIGDTTSIFDNGTFCSIDLTKHPVLNAV
jgi:hypothetical protein